MAFTVTHLVFDGVADGPLGVALELVHAARRLAKAEQVPRQRVVSVDGAAVRSSAGREVTVDGAFSLRGLGRGDVVVIAGLGLATPAQLDAALVRPDVVRGIELIARAEAKGVLVAASCSATFLLGAAGVLDGREATTTWWLGATFAARFPRVTVRADQMVVESRGVFTAGAALAHADLLLAILSRRVSPSLAHLVAKYLVLDERPSQARYMVMQHLRSADPVVSALEGFITRNLRRQVSLAEMARATATSPRTLARKLSGALGTTPQHFAQRLRIAQAVHQLETTQRPVDEVAARVGYADAAAFRRVFRRETGESPRVLRARVRHA